MTYFEMKSLDFDVPR